MRLASCLFFGLLLLCGASRVALPGEKATKKAEPGRLLVKSSALSTLKGALSQAGSSVITEIEGTEWVLVDVPTSKSDEDFLEDLEALTCVKEVQEDFLHEATGSTLPAGGLILACDIPDQDELERIGAAEARERATGDGVRIAVIDTGILEDLEGVSGNVDMADGWDSVDYDSDATDETDGVDDDDDDLEDEMHAHGTFVASLIVAVAPDVRIVPFRALNADGIGTSTSIAQAIARAVSEEVDAIQLSVAIDPNDMVVKTALENAVNAGIQVVASAGNTGSMHGDLIGPLEAVCVVTAVDEDDVRADFASYGNSVDLSAPGVDLSGAYPEDPGTAIWSGTSFSSALVSGGFALIRELNPSWSNSDVIDQLASTSVDVDSLNSGYSNLLGAGRIDLDAATAP